MSKNRTEYFREYNRKRKARLAAEKTAVESGETVPSPPPEATSGELEDKADLLDQYCESIGAKPNPRPTQAEDASTDGEKKPEEPGVTPGAPRPPMALPPSIWQFADARLRQFFEKEIKEDPASAPTPLDKESARYMSEALAEGMAHSKMTMNPWYGFGIIMFMWALPYLMLAFKKFSKGKKKKGEPNNYAGEPIPGVRPTAAAPAPYGYDESGQPRTAIPIGPGDPNGAIAGDLAGRDRKLAESYVHSGAPPDRQDDAGGQAVPAPVQE